MGPDGRGAEEERQHVLGAQGESVKGEVGARVRDALPGVGPRERAATT